MQGQDTAQQPLSYAVGELGRQPCCVSMPHVLEMLAAVKGMRAAAASWPDRLSEIEQRLVVLEATLGVSQAQVVPLRVLEPERGA